MQKLTIIGAGAWGTALAIQFAKRGHAVALWGRDKRRIAEIAASRCNGNYLPGVLLPELISLYDDFAAAVAEGDYIVLVTPTATIRHLAKQLNPLIQTHHRGIAWASKGIEVNSGCFLHQAIAQETNSCLPLAAISGPSFASELAAGLPTALTVASPQLDFAEELADLLRGDWLRVYTTDDMVGVECGGALKNIIAIAAGIASGMQLGENARAALITRGLNEMIRFSEAMGGKRATVTGLAGMGDVILSCSGDQSRNWRFGIMVAQCPSARAARKEASGVIEGVPTAEIVMQLANLHNIEMPICSKIAEILADKVSASEALVQLFERKATSETA